MNIKECFEKYPALKESFWPYVSEINHMADHTHPLTALISGSEPQVAEIAIRTDKCVQLVNKINPNWLKEKIKIILKEEDCSNVAAILGEIRAYGELIWIKDGDIYAGKSGSDFSFNIDGINIQIEVNTPQHRSKRHTMEHETFTSDKVKLKIYEIFPFGWPEREIDNIQGEAISKIASIKKREHQFREDSINILWVDLKDHSLCLGSNQFLPISAYREVITSGAFWNAFYAKKGTYIYDQLSVHGLSSRVYQMEYNGRFWNNSLVDFIIVDTRTDQIVFQNFKRDINIPNELFRSMHLLFGFNLELSWLDWPVKGQLLKRVELELERIQSYKDIFNPVTCQD